MGVRPPLALGSPLPFPFPPQIPLFSLVAISPSIWEESGGQELASTHTFILKRGRRKLPLVVTAPVSFAASLPLPEEKRNHFFWIWGRL